MRYVSAAFALLCAGAAALLTTPFAHADLVKARKDGVRVFSEASSTAKVVRTLKKDEVLNTRHRFGSFFAIDIGTNAIGYVRALDTAKVEDKDANAFRKSLEGRVGKVEADDGSSSARARSSSSVMGVRGLADDGDGAARADVRPDMRHVRVMEERLPSSQRLDAFESAVFEEIERLETKQAKAPSDSTLSGSAPALDSAIAPTTAADSASTPTSASASASSPASTSTLDEAAALVERQAETELGRGMAGRLLALTPPLRDATVSAYVNDVGAYVARAAGTPNRVYTFEVLASESINAFACPGGYVFITVGALRQVESESELAAILGHEIVHVKERHILQALKGRDFAKEKASSEKAGADTILDSRKRPAAASSEIGSFLSKQLLGPQAAGISLLQALDASMGILLSKGLERKLELEADQGGVALAASAGYDAGSLQRYFARVRSKATGSAAKGLEKTHPSFLDRENALLAFLKTDVALSTTGAFGTPRFQRVLKRIAAVKESSR